MTSPRRGTIADLVSGLLDRNYQQAAGAVLDAMSASLNRGIITQRRDELAAEAARLAEAGQRLRADNPVLRALLADLEDVLRADAILIDSAAEPLQRTGIDAAGKIQRQLALPGMTDAQLARIGIRWNVPDPEAINRVVQYATSAAWRDRLAVFPDEIVATIRNQALRGVASGWGPLRTAREISRQAEQLPLYQANNMMRTLQLTSYRDSTALHQQANVAIAQEIIRIAALDDRTCMSCISQHGTVIWSSETGGPVPRVNDHHSGRCNSVVRVTGRQVNVVSGRDWFDRLPEDRKLTIAGPAKLEALNAGAIGWGDFSQRYEDPVYGEMLREASLSGILGADAAGQYKR